MAENHARRDRRGPLVVREIRLGQIFAKGPVQIEQTRVDKRHHTSSKHRLAQRRGREDRVGCDWAAPVAAVTDRDGLRRPASIHEPDSNTRNTDAIQELTCQ